MKKSYSPVIVLLVVCLLGLGYHFLGAQSGAQSFVNWESPHVHPLEITPDGTKLLAVNTADNRLEVFSISGRSPAPVSLGSIPVGLDPVSVRARTDTEAWVVNRVSDSVSIIDLNTFNVVATLQTDDEPGDVVFAGNPQRAFVSTSTSDNVMVFDPVNLAVPPVVLDIEGQHPRAMAVSPDGTKVYVAILESGNRTTTLGPTEAGPTGDPFRNPINDASGPYGGVNPPPNNGQLFNPPINPDIREAPQVTHIVRKDNAGRWMDDNRGDWTEFVSGARAEEFERIAGWDVFDNDVAVIDATTLAVSYVTGLMNVNMALAVNPTNGKVTVVGTEATNQIRFEPVLKGRFIRVHLATVDGANPAASVPVITDLNPHLDYSDAQVAAQSNPATASQSLRDLSIGDPRAVVWNHNGTVAYVAGMGSNNVVVIDSLGARLSGPIVVGEGPTGLALHRARLYVLNRFEATISVVSTQTRTELARVPFSFDPTPAAIKLGRKFQYNTHLTSGLGHIACASCHVDSRMDRLAWDLGNPAGDSKAFDQNCLPDSGLFGSCGTGWHPMKGPMTTQTLQDIIGKEPFHWRGDRFGIEEFSGAFTGLQGDDVEPTATEMQQYEDFLATIFFPPNPFRNFDNSLPIDLPLRGQFSGGVFAARGGLPKGAPMPNGNAVNGLAIFSTLGAHSAGNPQGRNCISCHILPTGLGTDSRFVGEFPRGFYEPFPVGPNGERHHSMTRFSFPNGTLKIVQLRSLYQKVGFTRAVRVSRSGFGSFHHGGAALLEFIDEFPAPFMQSDQAVADVIAFLMAFSGVDPPTGSPDLPLSPPATAGQNTHPAVGAQITMNETNINDATIMASLTEMTALADTGAVGLVAKARREGVQRGFTYLGGGVFQTDRLGKTITTDNLRLSSGTGAETTFTVVPKGSETRIGIDRDEDGILDGDDAVPTSTAQVTGSWSHNIQAVRYSQRQERLQPVAGSRSGGGSQKRGH